MPTPIKITRWKGAAQMASRMNGHETGFADIIIKRDEWYQELSTKHYFILFIKKGSILLSTKLYHNKVIKEQTMAFVSKGGKFAFRAMEDTEMIMFAFTTTIIRSDKEMLDYFCTHAGKRDYTFNTLPICKAMEDLLNLIHTQIHEKKLKNSGICHVWNTYFFHIMSSYYEKNEITAFMRPILAGGADFESFIENNYLEAGGNVSRLIALSGLSTATFNNKFFSIYGMKPKKWLDEKIKNTIIEMAQDGVVTPSLIARELELSPQRLNDLTNRFWNTSAGEVVKRVQRGELRVEDVYEPDVDDEEEEEQ